MSPVIRGRVAVSWTCGCASRTPTRPGCRGRLARGRHRARRGTARRRSGPWADAPSRPRTAGSSASPPWGRPYSPDAARLSTDADAGRRDQRHDRGMTVHTPRVRTSRRWRPRGGQPGDRRDRFRYLDAGTRVPAGRGRSGVRPSRRGHPPRHRGPREHRPRVPPRPRARLRLPRDRRARDLRRCPAGVPRHGARPGDRPHRFDLRHDVRRGAGRPHRGPRAGADAGGAGRGLPGRPLQHRPQVRRRRRRARRLRRGARACTIGCWSAPSRDDVCRSSAASPGAGAHLGRAPRGGGVPARAQRGPRRPTDGAAGGGPADPAPPGAG